MAIKTLVIALLASTTLGVLAAGSGHTIEHYTTSQDVELRADDDAATIETDAALMAYWRKVGDVEDNILTYIISPTAGTEYAWPSGYEAFNVIRTDTSLIIATNGLGAPFYTNPDADQNGYGMELFIEVEGLQDLSLDEVMASDAFPVLAEAARQAAAYGGFVPQLSAHGPLSIELPVSRQDFPKTWLTERGSAGALLGLPAPGRPTEVADMPLSPVRMVPVTLLAPDELWMIAYNPPSVRDAVIEALASAGVEHRSDFSRSSVLDQ